MAYRHCLKEAGPGGSPRPGIPARRRGASLEGRRRFPAAAPAPGHAKGEMKIVIAGEGLSVSQGHPDRDLPAAAIVPAGGAGRRMGGPIPKQYLPLGGVPILVWTLRALERSPAVNDVIVVVPREDRARVEEMVLRAGASSKVRAVVDGGGERQASVWNGLQALAGRAGVVVVHDAVRPLLSLSLLGRMIRAARRHGAATAGLPVAETVKTVDRRGWVRATVPREGLWLTQTPQAFDLDLLWEAHRRAAAEGFFATDDAALVERMGCPVRMIRGSRDNLKLTTAEDLALAEALLCCPRKKQR